MPNSVEDENLSSALLTKQASLYNKIPRSQIVMDIFRRGVPMALAYTYTLSIVTIAALIARYGDKKIDDGDDAISADYLAAATLATTVANTAAVVQVSPFLVMSILGSNEYGQWKDNKTNPVIKNNIANLYKSAIMLGTVIYPVSFLTMYFSKDMLKLFGQNEHIAHLAGEFLRAYAFAMPGIMYRLHGEQMLFALDESVAVMLMSWTSFGIGTGLAYWLAFGSPDFGLAGIAYGYVIESYLTMLAFNIYLLFHPALEGIPFLKGDWINEQVRQKAKAILKMGLPVTAQLVCELAATMLMAFYAGWLGEDELAAQNFATQLYIFIMIPSNSFAQAVAQMVAELIGKEDFNNASRVARYGLCVSSGTVALICAPIAAAPTLLTRIFASSIDDNVMKIAKMIIPIMAVSTTIEALGSDMIQVLRNAKDFNKPTMIKIACLWLGMLGAYLFGFQAGAGMLGVALGFLGGLALGTAILLPRWVDAMQAKNLEIKNTPKISDSATQVFFGCDNNEGGMGRTPSMQLIPQQSDSPPPTPEIINVSRNP